MQLSKQKPGNPASLVIKYLPHTTTTTTTSSSLATFIESQAFFLNKKKGKSSVGDDQFKLERCLCGRYYYYYYYENLFGLMELCS
jgi:hypothetical protein